MAAIADGFVAGSEAAASAYWVVHCPGKAECTAGDIGLEVVIEAPLDLAANLNGVLAANQGESRAQVVLRVVIADGAITLDFPTSFGNGKAGVGGVRIVLGGLL